MKLTKRQREIIEAIRDGARLHPPGFCSRQWRIIHLPATSMISEWVKNDTIQGMKEAGMFARSVADGQSWLIPSPAALETLGDR